MISSAINKYRNTGMLDRLLRAVVGVLLIYFGFINTGFIGQGLLAALIGVFGVINVAAAVAGVCPIYTLAGISTCASRKAENPRE